MDLRENKEAIDKLASKSLSPITTIQGLKMQKAINAIQYMECSALTSKGVKNVFEVAIRAALYNRIQPVKQPTRQRRKCVIL
jgi:GTPase SAR1 family protein